MLHVRLRLVYILLVLTVYLPSMAQNIGVGGSVAYNFQTEGIGAGARVSIFPTKKLSIVPQFSYYFPFNKVTEYYAGLGLEYKLIQRKKVVFYVLAHGAYNSWNNYDASPMTKAQKNNWNAEGGIGISGAKCLRPFFECRYNAKFREAHVQLGLLYIFGCEEKKWGFGWGTGGDNRGRRGKKNNPCAAFD